MRTKSIQKQVKSISINKVGIMFHVELMASFLDLMSKQARLNAAVSMFLFKSTASQEKVTQQLQL